MRFLRGVNGGQAEHRLHVWPERAAFHSSPKLKRRTRLKLVFSSGRRARSLRKFMLKIRKECRVDVFYLLLPDYHVYIAEALLRLHSFATDF